MSAINFELTYPGIVAPAHYAAPPYVTTLGAEVAAVATLAGFPPDPEQQFALDVTFGRDARGKSSATEIACVCCRQNMKTGYLKMVELGWLFVTDERLVVHSAHEFSTAREAYRDLKELIEASPVLLGEIAPDGFKDTPADMSIKTKTGARLVFKTRTKGGGRGLSGRKVVLDEAFALQAAHMGALRPLISAQPDPQIIYASSACRPESEVLWSVVQRGRKGGEPRLGYCEWCARPAVEACKLGDACSHEYGKVQGCAMDDPSEWQRANPAAGRRIAFETIEDERRAAVGALVIEFGRERMGWHDAPSSGVSVLDVDKWEGQVEQELDYAGPVVIAFDVQPGNLSASIAAVGRLKVTEDVLAQALALGLDTATLGAFARLRGEITGRGDDDLDNRPGVDWLVERLAEIAVRQKPLALAFDPTGPAGAFKQALLEYRTDPERPNSTLFVEVPDDERTPAGKVRLVEVAGTRYAQACGAIDADIRNDRIRHMGQQALDQAVVGARARDLGDGAWKFSRKDSTVNLAPLVAFTIARYAFTVYGKRKASAGAWAVSV